MQETQILEQLAHPNIVKYLGHHNVSPRELHLFMEYLPFSLEVCVLCMFEARLIKAVVWRAWWEPKA